jgi:broad specificity phosphatase PhoE
MTIFYLVRHAEPNWKFKDERNLNGPLRDYVPLTENGIQQAENIINNYSCLVESEIILSSPFTRSLQTAAIINRKLGLPIHVEFDLHEWIPDKFQANTLDEIIELHQDFNNHDGCVPNGETKLWETKESVMNRAKNVLNRFLDKKKVMVVCHGMVINILMEYGTGLDVVELGSVHEMKIEI